MTTTKNNEHKKLNVPNLRFPEFQGEWTTSLLSDYLTENKERNKKGEFDKTDVLSVSGDYGIVNQIELLGRSFAGASVLPYHVVRHGNIVYTKSPLKEYPYGIVKANTGVDGIVSTLYAVYNIKNNVDAQFIEYYFSSANRTNRYFKPIVRIGAKHDMKIGNQEVLANKVTFPNLKEQTKIASLFRFLDERIATQNKIIDKLQSLIKGINQSIFMNNNVINYKLGEVCEIRSGYSGNQLLSKKGLKVSRIETISGHKVNMERVGYVAPFESSENYRLRVGDILFSNINSVEYIGNTAFIDKDYDLYHGMNLLRLTPNNMVVIPFYLYLLLNTNRMLNHFKTVCNKAVSQASINQTELGKTVIQIPPIKTQEQICELYQALYTKLETASHIKSLFQNQKQYMLRQMFI